MARVSILWKKPSDFGVYIQGSWSVGLPLANAITTDVKKVARSTDAATTSTKFRVDIDSVMPETISDFVLLAHNLTTAAKIRFVVTTDATDSSAPARTLDTGLLDVWVPTVVYGSLPWGVWPWNGIDEEAYPSGTAFFHRSTQVGLGRYIWVYIEDAANAAGFVEFGKFMAGTAWSPAVNVDYGSSIQWVDSGEAKRTRGGRKLVTTRPRFRKFQLTFGYLTEDEALGVTFEIDRQLGKEGDFYLAMDVDEPGQLRFRRSIYASLIDTNQVVNPDVEIWTWTLAAEELI